MAGRAARWLDAADRHNAQVLERQNRSDSQPAAGPHERHPVLMGAADGAAIGGLVGALVGLGAGLAYLLRRRRGAR